MIYIPYVPDKPPLAGAIEFVFSLQGYSPEHRFERLVPNGRVNLVIELDDRDRYVYDNQSGEPIQVCRVAWLSGVHSRYLTFGETGPDSRLAAVQLAPGRARPWVHQPLDKFNDRVAPATEAYGESIQELRQRLKELKDGEQVVREIEDWLEAIYDPRLEPPQVVREAVDAMVRAPSEINLTSLVRELGTVSHRHFVKLFKQHVGPNPKLLQRILRFSQVFERIQGQKQVDWATLSLELGYSDQAHFIRDFRAFSGYRPQRFAGAEHERLNFFPDDKE